MTEDPTPHRHTVDHLHDIAGYIIRPPWQRHAACRGRLDVEWFPPRGQRSEEALAICARCLVVDACLEHALSVERFGIWGGLPERPRRRIRQARNRARLAAETKDPPGVPPRRPGPSGPRGAAAAHEDEFRSDFPTRETGS